MVLAVEVESDREIDQVMLLDDCGVVDGRSKRAIGELLERGDMRLVDVSGEDDSVVSAAIENSRALILGVADQRDATLMLVEDALSQDMPVFVVARDARDKVHKKLKGVEGWTPGDGTRIFEAPLEFSINKLLRALELGLGIPEVNEWDDWDE